jgi:glucokinase-like ROK family protein
MRTRASDRTGDQALVRRINLSLIMQMLRTNAPISRAGLADMTGLNKTTVSSLVNELITRGFVREVGLESGTTGRPAILLSLDPAAGYIVSGEIGVDFISVICCDFAPNVIWRQLVTISPEMSQRTILDRALLVLNQAVEAGRNYCDTLLGVAVGVPGIVDYDSGRLLFAPNLKWEDVPLMDLLRQSIDATVIVDNEANLAVLGEYYFGAAQGYEEVLYISAGVGLGGGTLQGGFMRRGASGMASEFGHMTMDPDGAACNCGNIGCWETQVSQNAIFRYIRESMRGKENVLAKKTKGDLNRLTIPIVVESARLGDPVALEALRKTGRYLGIGIASLINAFNPELIVFGGILSLAWDFLEPAIQEEIGQRALRWATGSTKVVLAKHGVDAAVMGGVATVYQTILQAPGESGDHLNRLSLLDTSPRTIREIDERR